MNLKDLKSKQKQRGLRPTLTQLSHNLQMGYKHWHFFKKSFPDNSVVQRGLQSPKLEAEKVWEGSWIRTFLPYSTGSLFFLCRALGNTRKCSFALEERTCANKRVRHATEGRKSLQLMDDMLPKVVPAQSPVWLPPPSPWGSNGRNGESRTSRAHQYAQDRSAGWWRPSSDPHYQRSLHIPAC